MKLRFAVDFALWTFAAALAFAIVMCAATFASVSGGDDAPPSSDGADRVMIALWIVVSLLVGLMMAIRSMKRRQGNTPPPRAE